MNRPPGIAAIADPAPIDYRRAVVTQVHFAREMLSLAERQADSDSPQPVAAISYIEAALTSLKASCTLLHETDSEDAVRMETLLDRSVHAARAALGHVLRYQSYRNTTPSKLERDQLSRLRPVWRRSAEEAKKDVHRALMFICERWPNAYERESI